MRNPAPLSFSVNDKVDKTSGTLERFTNGKIIALGRVRSNQIRYMVESESGELFICSAKCLRRAVDK